MNPGKQRRRQRASRLRLYNNVARHFQQTYRSAIEAGYRSLGLTPPNFESLSRSEALEQIRVFRERMDRGGSAPAAATALRPLLEGLRDLSNESIIPMAWVE